jgi:hypothetical protein
LTTPVGIKYHKFMAKVSKDIPESIIQDIEKIEAKKLGFKISFNKKYLLIISVLVILALIPSLYFYNQYQSTKDLLQNPKAQTNAQTKSLVDAVGRLIELPTNEQPRLATVTDVTQLAGQPFFAKAQNGDKVLIYAQLGKAILYRESINKIIEVASVNATAVGAQNTQPTSVSPTLSAQAQSASVMILNGTITSGLAKAAQTKIASNLSNITVLGTGDSINSNYQSTIVVDLTGSKSEVASQLAKLLGGKVGTTIPNGENKPNSDILVIIGSDFVK